MPQWLDEAGDAIRNVIRAYHGSPYDFDKFSAAKIGTGEGNQAYGHGMYFASAEPTALAYRKALKTTVDLPVPRELQEAYIAASTARNEAINDRGLWMRKNPKTPYPYQENLDAMDNRFYALQSQIHAAAHNPGRMYEVEIGVPENALLDWDAPISKQPAAVRRAFGEFAMDKPGDGGRVYRDIATRRGEEFDDDMTGMLANRAASEELLNEGIPGIRYLDGLSRGTGQGTRNYVMFPGTEDQIRILRKYGLMAPIAAGAAAGASEQPSP